MNTGKIAVIMFTDMVGYSKKMQSNERRALELLGEHNRLLGAAIKAYNGNVIKTIGDAFFADFDSVASAIKCAAEIQSRLTERNADAGVDEQIEVRIGIHVGEVHYRQGDIFGDGVNIASRIESSAGAGQVFVSADVQSMAAGKIDYNFRDVGPLKLKNISNPVRVYEVLWDPDRVAERVSIKQAAGKRVQLPLAAIAAMLVLPIIAAALVYQFVLKGGPADSNAGKPSLVILPFSDSGGGESLREMSIGKIISDAFVQKFYEFPNVRLVSPLRVAQALKDRALDGAAVAADIGAAAGIGREMAGRLLLTGEIRKILDDIVLVVDLNDLETDKLIAKAERRVDDPGRLLRSEVDSLFDELQRKIAGAFKLGDVKPIAGIGELTTESLEAYSKFIKGYELAASGVFHPGIDIMLESVEIDSEFAMALSFISCAYSFAKEDELSEVYHEKALQYKDKLTGISKEALIFQGNVAWGMGDNEETARNYKLVIDLYPDDRDGYLYYGLFLAYQMGDHKHAMEQLKKAAELSPGYFPPIRDLAYSTKIVTGEDAAIALLQGFIRDYPEEPGVTYARNTIAEIRGESDGE